MKWLVTQLNQWVSRLVGQQHSSSSWFRETESLGFVRGVDWPRPDALASCVSRMVQQILLSLVELCIMYSAGREAETHMRTVD